MKKIISLLLSIILIFSCSNIIIAEAYNKILNESSRGISLLANYYTESLDKRYLYINEYNQELLIKRKDISISADGSEFLI